MSDWSNYRKKGVQQMRPYIPGEDMRGISISEPDKQTGSPKNGDMIARDSVDKYDQWLVSADFFARNYEPITV